MTTVQHLPQRSDAGAPRLVQSSTCYLATWTKIQTQLKTADFLSLSVCLCVFNANRWNMSFIVLPPFSAVFTWTNLLVVVVELEGSEQEALDLVALVTNVVLEEHFR